MGIVWHSYCIYTITIEKHDRSRCLEDALLQFSGRHKVPTET